jgi:hypothetical protein
MHDDVAYDVEEMIFGYWCVMCWLDDEVDSLHVKRIAFKYL